MVDMGKMSKTFIDASNRELAIAINEYPEKGSTRRGFYDSNAIWFYAGGELNMSFSVNDVQAMIAHLSSLVSELESRKPRNSDIIEDIPFGTTFKYEGATGYVTTYFRFAGGVMSSGGRTYSDFTLFNQGPAIEIEENK